MKKHILFIFLSLIFLAGCDKHVVNPENYSGIAQRSETSCLSDCMTCKSTDKVEIVIDAQEQVRLVTTGPCMAFGAECIYRDTCSWMVVGEYGGNNGRFTFSSCNDNTFLATGVGTSVDGKTSGSVKCYRSDSKDFTQIDWADVPIVKVQ